MQKRIFYFLLVLALPLLGPLVQAQAQPLVQLTGLVVAGDQDLGVPGIVITVPATRRGTQSNGYGYFSMPVRAGDSLVIAGLGYKRQYYRVPNDGRQSVSILVHLQEDTLFAPTIELIPYATEDLFKEAFLALKLPERDYNAMRQNLEEQKLAMMRYNMPNDGSQNHQYFMDNQIYRQEMRTFQPTVQLTNPFAWARFIQSLKRGDLKRKNGTPTRDVPRGGN